MLSVEIEEFAKVLVEQVRDTAIQNNDQCVSPQSKHAIAVRWRRTIGFAAHLQKLMDVVVPDAVDETVFQLLRAIDEGFLRMTYTASNGKTVDLNIDGHGELAGWYMGITSQYSWTVSWVTSPIARLTDTGLGYQTEVNP